MKMTKTIPVWLDRATRLLIEDIIGELSQQHSDLLAVILRWLDMAVTLFFPRFISYSMTERAVSRGGRKAYDEADIKRNVYLLC